MHNSHQFFFHKPREIGHFFQRAFITILPTFFLFPPNLFYSIIERFYIIWYTRFNAISTVQGVPCNWAKL